VNKVGDAKELDMGIMQGRLLPPIGERIQAFPINNWRQEFPLAYACGLRFIEWIYEHSEHEQNPIASEKGINEIHDLAEATGVRVFSICADYFMDALLVNQDGTRNIENIDHLRWLIKQVKRLYGTTIVLPFVDSSSLQTIEQRASLVDVLADLDEDLDNHKIQIHLELDLEPKILSGFLGQLSSANVRVVYDIGNSAALGYSPQEELDVIGNRLGTVHIKDRERSGGTVSLGRGNADFETIFEIFNRFDFRGPYTFQAARVSDLSEKDLARENLEFFQHHWDRWGK
jgi:L-ribulose-5-phosphate 3-epimerase